MVPVTVYKMINNNSGSTLAGDMMPGCSRNFINIHNYTARMPLTLNEVRQLMLRVSGKDYAKAGLV